jgi:hypothetical protein
MMWFLASLWFLPNLWFLGELVVFGRACGSPFPSRASNANRRLLWIRSSAQATRKRVVFAELVVLACGFWIARSALRVRNGKSPPKATKTNRQAQATRKRVVFAELVVLVGLVVFAVFVVFGRACGFWARSISHIPPTHTQEPISPASTRTP